MARPKGETEEKEINMTQAEQDRIAERWLRMARNHPADKAILQFRKGHAVKRGGMKNEYSLRD